MVWYPPFPQNLPHLHAICSIAAFQIHGLPFACYVQHFRAATFHLQPMCSILEPYTSYKNTLVSPMCYLHAVYILPIYIYVFVSTYIRSVAYLYINHSLCNPTNTYYIIFPCRYMPLCNLLYTTHSVPIYHLCPIHLRLTSCISPAIPPPPTPHGRGQPHTLLRYLILLMHMYMYHVCVY